MKKQQEAAASRNEEETVVVHKTAIYEPSVTQTMEEKRVPFVMTQHN
jgi:hypothetical protein